MMKCDNITFKRKPDLFSFSKNIKSFKTNKNAIFFIINL